MKTGCAALGNLFEHYDTALFGLLSPFLAPLLFPKQEPLTALILTYALIPLGMLARPLGALVFGRIGDVYGRRDALRFTLIGMGIVSLCMACLPLEGGLAPLFFFSGRALQNFLSAGETIGGALFLLENAPESRRDLLSGLYNSTTIGGHLLASCGVYFLCCYDFGWRLLYLLGGITGLFGALIRSQAPKNSVKLPAEKNGVWMYRKSFFAIVLCSGFASATFSLALVLMNGWIPLISSHTKTELVKINSLLLIFDFCALPVFGLVASKVGRERLMLCASLGAALCAIPLCRLAEEASLLGVLWIRMCFVMFGVAFFAPFHAWAQELIPQGYRYRLIAFGYAVGTMIGAPTAALSLWCFKQTGILSSVAWYPMALALGCSVAIAMLSRRSKRVISN